MKNEKIIRKYIAVFLGTFLIFFTCTTSWAASTDVYFTIEKSTVANMYYEVLVDGEPASNGTVIEVVDPETGEIIARDIVEDGVIFIENMPFGAYILRCADDKDREILVLVDTSYLLTAHEKKILDFSKENKTLLAPTTGDESGLLLAAGALFAAAIGLLVLFVKRKEDETNEE